MKDQNTVECSRGKPVSSPIWYLDVLRIFAAFCVVINHTNSGIFLQGGEDATTFVSLAYFFISKCAVPLFFMISGILLLRKQETFSQVFSKRMWRPALALFMASLVWYLLNLQKLSDFRWNELWENIRVCIGLTPMWFLYTYIGVLCMLPMLQRIVFHADYKLLRGIMIGWLIYGCIYPYAVNVLKMPPITGYLQLPFFSGYVGYLFMGYYLHNNLNWSRKATCFCGGFCFIVGWSWAVGYTWGLFRSSGTWILTLDELMYPPCVLISVGIFLLVKGLCESWQPHKRTMRLLEALRKSMFGVYLLHPFVIRDAGSWYSFLTQKLPKFTAVILWEIEIFAVSLMISYLFSIIMKTIFAVSKRIIKREKTS